MPARPQIVRDSQPTQTDVLAATKLDLRRQMRGRIAAIPLAARDESSATICERLLDSVYFAAARVVMAYAPLPTEVDVTPVLLAVLRSGRTLLIPRVDWAAGTMEPAVVSAWPADVVSTKFGVREPAAHLPAVPAEQIDLALVPGLAFDVRGGRLGRGAGFYDRFFAASPFNTVKVGLAFEGQIIDRIPMRYGGLVPDVRMDAVLTERRKVVGCTDSGEQAT